MRSAKKERNTLETQISVYVNLDGSGKRVFNTGLPFLEHMLDQIARHGMFDIDIEATGDLEIDAHHTVEDIGITLGQAFAEAVGDKRGIRRYGHAYVPLDEALSIFPAGPAWSTLSISPGRRLEISMLICFLNFFRGLLITRWSPCT